MKHILFYKWENCCEDSIIRSLKKMEYHVDTLIGTMMDYDHDQNMINAFLTYFEQCKAMQITCNAVFSIDYFPLISNVCEHNDILYISWFVDYPMTTMYSKSIFHKCNRIFAFDSIQYQELVHMGVQNCFHMPLATDTDQWDALEISREDQDKYSSDISFIGNLYNNETSNKYNSIHTFSDYIKGYFDGLIEAQLKVYGYNFIDNVLDDTVVNETKKYLELNLGPLYLDVYKKLLSDIINRQISMLERRNVLNLLGNRYDLDLYTSSNIQDITAKKVRCKGYVDYNTVMPKIFRLSKINLNITSKSIISGIPLRVLDIMGAGGFVMTNYQPEIAQYFENGIEIVMYESMEDLQQKTAYYLNHDEERESIALAGYQKVKERFSYEVRLVDIMEKAFK